MGNTASAHPSKLFFVGMLTRDIELGDAILDLIDNCIDGIQREISGTARAKQSLPYAKFNTVLNLDKRSFSIRDNCGGIPRENAEKYAFRLGRPSDMPPERLPTVGVYGIGMKRAMFKIGRSSKVTTVHAGNAYQVAISSQWMDSDQDWDLPIKDLNATQVPGELKGTNGTLIEIGHLKQDVAQEFDPQASNFIETLRATIATHYSYIIHKGFAIDFNGAKVRPKALALLVSDQKQSKDRIEPFVYHAKKDGVTIDLVIGLYRNIPSQQEIDEELDGRSATGRRETCGWTIICNDRVVVYNDKSRLTGWGEATVPAYHPQFNAIAGIVRFQSADMSKLPVTTTKRGLEASSDLYLAVKDVMREGLKHFTSFTNQWKSKGPERDALLKAAIPTDPFEATKHLPENKWSDVRKGLGGKKYAPALPRPSAAPKTEVTIRFTRRTKDVKAVADHLFNDDSTDPSKVGEECFDRFFQRAKR